MFPKANLGPKKNLAMARVIRGRTQIFWLLQGLVDLVK